MNNLFIDKITALLGDRFSTAESVRANYSKGEDIFDSILKFLSTCFTITIFITVNGIKSLTLTNTAYIKYVLILIQLFIRRWIKSKKK